MDNSTEKEMKDQKNKEIENRDKKNFIANKYKDALKETDIIKEIEQLKKRIAMNYNNALNLNANQIQKEPKKESEIIEVNHQKDNQQELTKPINNDLENISKIALNIVNKVALKKDNKTHNKSNDDYAKDSDDNKNDLNDDTNNCLDCSNSKKDIKSDLSDESEDEDIKDEPIKLSELESDNESKIKQKKYNDEDTAIYVNNNTKDEENSKESIAKPTITPVNPIIDQIQNNQIENQISKQEAQQTKEINNNKLKQDNKQSKQQNEAHQLESSSLSNALSTGQLNQKFQLQIKLIEEKSVTNLIEQEQNLKKLRKVEETLQIDERITHENREIRKNACREITQMCTEDFTEEEKKEFFECFSPWVKYYIEETNPYVLPEAMNFFLVFNHTFSDFKVNSLNDFFDNLERIASFGISSLNDLSRKIIEMFIKDKKLFNQTFTELMKSWNKSSIRLIKFLHDLISDMIFKGVFNENCIKIIFEKSIHIYLSINSKNSEKKKINGKLIVFIYNLVEDDLNTIQNNIHVTSKKEFNSLLSKSKKSNREIKYRLYTTTSDENNNESVGHNSLNQKTKNQLIQEQSKQERDSNIPTASSVIPSEVNDLCSIFPNAFFEFNLLSQFTEKITLLEEVNKILQKVKEIKDKEKNYNEIYKALNFTIEDSNILIHLEGIKVFKHVSCLLHSHINNHKAKNLLESCFEKLKDKKSIVRDELFSLFDVVLSNLCLTFDSFIILVLQFCLNDQKKAVTIVKQGVLEYLKQLMKSNNATMKECIAVKCDKSYLVYSKYLVDLIANESQSTIKDLCTDLLLMFKSRMRNQDYIAQFNDLTKNLPSYRKNIVENDISDYCISESNTSYKKKLKNVKSNIYSKSIGKDRRMHSSFRKDNLSTPKNGEVNSSNKLKKQRNDNGHKMTKNYSSSNVLKSNKEKESFSNQMTNMRVIKKVNNIIDNDNDNKDKDNDSGNEDNKNNSNEKELKKCDIINKSSTTINKESNDINDEKKKKEILEKRKDDVVNHISSLNKKALEDYSKVIVRDFLFFVNKVSLGSLNDDLSSHFEVIFNILGKILERMLYLNRTNTQETDLTESTSNQISDDLINRIIKVVIILPCIDQVDGSSEFDMNLFNSFIASIKQASTTEEKFFIYLLVNLIKFSNKGLGFLEIINARPSIIFFLDYITHCKVKSDKVQSMLNEFVEETELLSREDKTKYLSIKGVSPISSREVTQNIADEEDEAVDEEGKNDDGRLNMNKAKIINQEDDDFLAKKIKESEAMIKIKQEENERLKQKIKLYEEKKTNDKQSPTMPISETTSTNQITPNNQQSAIPSLLHLSQGNIINKLIEESKDRLISNLKSTNSGDILKIKEQFNLTTKKLDLTLKRMVEKTENKEKDKSIKDQILSQIKQNPTNSNSNNNVLTPIKQIRNLEDCLLEEQEQSLFHQETKSDIQNAINQTPQSNSSSIQDIFNFQKESLPNYKPLIKQLVSFFEGNSHRLNIDELYSQLSLIYRKLQTSELKLDYIDYLKSKLCTTALLEKIPVNAYLQFYDSVLNLLSYELLMSPRDEQLVLHLQSITENLKGYRRISEMIQMMMVLLRKYFPKNLNNRLSDNSCVILQVIAYLIKELVKLIAKNKVEPLDIIAEINELFIITPPDTLKSSTPNFKLYEHIFTVLKSLTDEVYDQNKYSFKEVIEYLNENKITNKAYMKYLNNLCSMNH